MFFLLVYSSIKNKLSCHLGGERGGFPGSRIQEGGGGEQERNKEGKRNKVKKGIEEKRGSKKEEKDTFYILNLVHTLHFSEEYWSFFCPLLSLQADTLFSVSPPE